MAAPAGATHALQDLVWHRPMNTQHDRLYHVRLHDSVTGSCVMKADNVTATEIDKIIAWHKASGYNVKAFAYAQ